MARRCISCRARSRTQAAGSMRMGHSAVDVSTLKEPYRIEGKKTMAYELYEQLGGQLPDVIVYPTGGGTGLVGMWKAFGEMRALGWLDDSAPLPRMVSVQAAGCAPVVRGFESGAERTEPWANASTNAYGLRVPSPIGGFLCLRAIRRPAERRARCPNPRSGRPFAASLPRPVSISAPRRALRGWRSRDCGLAAGSVRPIAWCCSTPERG